MPVIPPPLVEVAQPEPKKSTFQNNLLQEEVVAKKNTKIVFSEQVKQQPVAGKTV